MLVIRKATEADVPAIRALIQELADYERAPHEVTCTEADLLRDGFGPSPAFHVLVTEDVAVEGEGGPGGGVFGFALYFFSYSTWKGRRSLFLEDLFVRPARRGQGAGKALMRRLAVEAREAGCSRFDWNVLDWNEPSIRFYEALGARILREWLPVRLDGQALRDLAVADPGDRC